MWRVVTQSTALTRCFCHPFHREKSPQITSKSVKLQFLVVDLWKHPFFFLISLSRYSWSKTPLKLGKWLSLLVDFGQAPPPLGLVLDLTHCHLYYLTVTVTVQHRSLHCYLKTLILAKNEPSNTVSPNSRVNPEINYVNSPIAIRFQGFSKPSYRTVHCAMLRLCRIM